MWAAARRAGARIPGWRGQGGQHQVWVRGVRLRVLFPQHPLPEPLASRHWLGIGRGSWHQSQAPKQGGLWGRVSHDGVGGPSPLGK